MQPLLPMGFGVTHDRERHGTTTLFAVLGVLSGQVSAQCEPRHRYQEFLGFLRAIETAVPPNLEVHLIVDDYSTHNHPKVKAWLAARPRWHLHFLPTYRSWLNLVERFFALITDRAIRRGFTNPAGQNEMFLTAIGLLEYWGVLRTYATCCKRFRFSWTGIRPAGVRPH